MVWSVVGFAPRSAPSASRAWTCSSAVRAP